MNTQIYEEACGWFVDLRAGDVDGAAAKRFNDWIRKSPEHLRAYLEVTEIWQDAPLVDAEKISSAQDLIMAARDDANIVTLEPATPAVRSAKGSGTPRRIAWTSARRFSMAATVLMIFGAALFAWLAISGAATYATGTGEQRSVMLADGSTMLLNAKSRVEVRYSEARREIALVQGQALFNVAKDPRRPFVVRSGNVQIRAVGTQFDVYRKKSGTTVTVVEGRIAVEGGAAVSNALSATKPLLLSAGEQVVASPKAVSKPQQADLDSTTAWTQRRLILHASPLTEVAEEFNRYNERRVIVADDLADFTISGVYSSMDSELLLRFLRQQPALLVRESDHAIRISRRE